MTHCPDNVPAPLQPLTGWEKTVAAVKGGVKTFVDYIPRGLLFSAVLVAGSFALGAMIPGGDLLGVVTPNLALGETLVGHIAKRVGITMLMGGGISGLVGAYQQVKYETNQREAQIMAAQGRSPNRARGQLAQLEQNQEYTPDLTRSHGLPQMQRDTELAPR